MDNNIDIANKTIRITKQGYYKLDGQTIQLCAGEYTDVEVYSGERIKALQSRFPEGEHTIRAGKYKFSTQTLTRRRKVMSMLWS